MGRLDLQKLLLIETILAFATSPFTAPPYNLAIFLFGTYAQDNAENSQALKTFTGLLGVSVVFDIIWMARNEQHGLILTLTIMLLLLKIPTFLASGWALRQRGTNLGGLQNFGGSGPTVWSMPGGFTSADGGGYQVAEPPSSASRQGPSTPSQPLVQAYQTI